MKPRIKNDKNMDSGMAIPTKYALRIPKKSINTPTTTSTPEIMLFSILLTISLVNED